MPKRLNKKSDITYCRDCGKPCKPRTKWGRRCQDCFRRKRREEWHARHRCKVSEIDVRRLGPMSPTELAKARTKPAGCSDVRWRIELRRRRSVPYFSAYGEKP